MENKLIRVKENNVTHGASNLSKGAVKKLNNEQLSYAIAKTGKFEAFWYPTFIIAGLLCLIFVGIYDSFTWELILSVITLWTCMLANNLAARGYRIGLLISSVEMVAYVVVCAVTKVWGEVIINIALYIPLEILGFIKWKESATGDTLADEKVEDVKRLSLKQAILCVSAVVVGSIAVWSVLKYLLHQSFAIFNAFSIVAFAIGSMLRNKRYRETWYLYMLGNIAGIILWSCVSTNVSLAVLPNVLSFIATLTNNFNGLYIWDKLYKHNKKSKGIYLAMRKVNIGKVAKLRRTYKNMTCKEL